MWIALTDGGSGLEEFCQQNFNRPDLVVILDFYHVAEYLSEWAKVLHPDEAEAGDVAKAWCHRLKHEGGEVVRAECHLGRPLLYFDRGYRALA